MACSPGAYQFTISSHLKVSLFLSHKAAFAYIVLIIIIIIIIIIILSMDHLILPQSPFKPISQPSTWV